MKKIQIKDFMNYHYLSSLQANPSKSAFGFVVAKADEENNNYQRDIWLYQKGKLKALTGLHDAGKFLWLNDKEMLIQTIRDSKDKEIAKSGKAYSVFYKLHIEGGEAQKAFSLPLLVNTIKVLSKNKFVLSAEIDANYPDLYQDDENNTAQYYRDKKENEDYEIIDEIPFWFNGTTFVNKKRTALFLYDAKKKDLCRISNPLMNVNGFEVDEDSNEVIYWGNTYTHISEFTTEVYAYQLAKSTTKNVYIGKEYNISMIKPSKEGYLCLMKDGLSFGLNQNPCFYHMSKKAEISLLQESELSIGSSVGSDCRLGDGKSVQYINDELYFTTTIKDSSHLYVYNKSISPVIEINGSIDDFELMDQKVLMIAMLDQKLQELYLYDMNTKECTLISVFNTKVLKNKYVAKPEKVSVLSNNIEIEGWVLKPKDFDHEKSYPAILDIHGGPKTVYGEVFYHEMQVWANKGYFVYFLNPVGSDGRGNEFADIRGKYGMDDYQNIMDFTDKVLDLYPSIDASKLAVTGGSYGGFMTNWIIGHSKRFVCAASQRSISNWISFYGVSDIGVRFTKDQQGVDDLVNDQEKLWWHSPLKYVNEVETPTLFIHSDQDYRCPMEQAMQMFTAIRARNIESKLVYFKGENHELSRGGKPIHRVKRLSEITNWIKSYTK